MTTKVDHILMGIGRLPAVQALGVIHAYPTHGEAIRMAAAACERTRTSRLKAWLTRLCLES